MAKPHFHTFIATGHRLTAKSNTKLFLQKMQQQVNLLRRSELRYSKKYSFHSGFESAMIKAQRIRLDWKKIKKMRARLKVKGII